MQAEGRASLVPLIRSSFDTKIVDETNSPLGYAFMISISTARKIILSMPEAEEKQHFGHPDFRVRNKIFATLWPDENRAVVKIPDRSVWSHCSAKVFSTNAWSKRGWINVHLEHVNAQTFRELVEDSWYAIAPPVFAARYGRESRHRREEKIVPGSKKTLVPTRQSRPRR